ncbi:MAG: hypothetical protein AAGE01_03525 [Pseudomonadota bacterium]
MARILICLHERDRRWRSNSLIFHMARIWKRRGHAVGAWRGAHGEPPPADVLIAHIDLTRIPEAYGALFERFPRVVNGGVSDISKRFVSDNLVGPSDAYAGRVIVKTDNNYGGIPEAFHARHQLDLEDQPWATRTHLKPSSYPVFDSIDDVPTDIWTNEALVVEKYIAERVEGSWSTRIAFFCGSRHFSYRMFSPEYVLKGDTVTRIEPAETPPDVIALRDRFKLDYGKLDYVIHDGRAIVFDVARTPGGVADQQVNREFAAALADGIDDYL